MKVRNRWSSVQGSFSNSSRSFRVWDLCGISFASACILYISQFEQTAPWRQFRWNFHFVTVYWTTRLPHRNYNHFMCTLARDRGFFRLRRFHRAGPSWGDLAFWGSKSSSAETRGSWPFFLQWVWPLCRYGEVILTGPCRPLHKLLFPKPGWGMIYFGTEFVEIPDILLSALDEEIFFYDQLLNPWTRCFWIHVKNYLNIYDLDYQLTLLLSRGYLHHREKRKRRKVLRWNADAKGTKLKDLKSLTAFLLLLGLMNYFLFFGVKDDRLWSLFGSCRLVFRRGAHFLGDYVHGNDCFFKFYMSW